MLVPEIKNKMKMSAITSAIQSYLKGPSRTNKERKKNS